MTLTQAEAKKVLAALEESEGLVEHTYATDWRHDFPGGKEHLEGMRKGVERHKEAIAIMLKAAEPLKPISDADILDMWNRVPNCPTFRDEVLTFARKLLEKAR